MTSTFRDNRRTKDINQNAWLPYLIQMEDGSRKQGILLLRSPNGKDLCVKVPYYYSGVHYNRSEDEWKDFNDKVGTCFASFPIGVSFTLEQSIVPKKLESADELNTQINDLDDNKSAYVLSKQDTRDRLSKQGKLNDIQLMLVISYHFDGNSLVFGKGFFDKLLIQCQSLWNLFKGIASEVEEQNVKDLLYGVSETNEDIEAKVSQIGLPLRPLSVEEIYHMYMHEMAFSYPNKPANWITFNRETGELSENITQPDQDIRVERYRDGLPILFPHQLIIKGQVVQALILEIIPSEWSSNEQCALSMWNLVNDFSNIKLVTQITPLDTRKEKPQLELKERTSFYDIQADVTNARAELLNEDVRDANFAFEEGQVAFMMSLVILVYGNSPEEVHAKCRQLTHRMQYPAKLVQEQYDCWTIYNQSQFHSPNKLCVTPSGNHRSKVLSSIITGFLPLVKPQSPYATGYELIAEGGTPFMIDYSSPRNALFIAMTRAGKSLFIADLLLFLHIKFKIPILIVDAPRSDGTSTFTTLSHLLDGAYVSISTEVCNLFELPSSKYVDWLDVPDHEQIRDFKDDLAVMLIHLLIGKDNVSADYKQEVEVIIGLSLEYFFNDEGIKERYRIAFSSDDWSSEERSVMPTLLDFITILVPESFPDNTLNIKALARIKNRLEVLSKGSCRCLAGVSSVNSNNNDLLVYALTKMSREQDALTYGFMVYLLTLRQSAKHDRQVVFIDEASILLRYDALSVLFGKLSANGNKAGIFLFFAVQDIESIMQSAAGEQILANIATTYIGRVKPIAIDNLQKVINCDRSLLEINSSKTFGQHGHELSSDWLVADIEGDPTHVKYFISPFLLALTGNTPSEEKARNLLMSYFYDPLEALIKFGFILKHCIAQSIKPDQYVLDLIEQANQQDMEVPDFINQLY